MFFLHTNFWNLMNILHLYHILICANYMENAPYPQADSYYSPLEHVSKGYSLKPLIQILQILNILFSPKVSNGRFFGNNLDFFLFLKWFLYASVTEFLRSAIAWSCHQELKLWYNSHLANSYFKMSYGDLKCEKFYFLNW